MFYYDTSIPINSHVMQSSISMSTPTNFPQINSLPMLSLMKSESGLVASLPQEVVDKAGYLSLCINHKKEKWDRFWFVLKNRSLFQYHSPTVSSNLVTQVFLL